MKCDESFKSAAAGYIKYYSKVTPEATQRSQSAQTDMRRLSALPRQLRGSNHLGRQGRLAFMAWVSGLFSPSGFSPLEPPFPSNLSFAATHSNFCGTSLTSFILQESARSCLSHFSQAALIICFAIPQRVKSLFSALTFRFAPEGVWGRSESPKNRQHQLSTLHNSARPNCSKQRTLPLLLDKIERMCYHKEKQENKRSLRTVRLAGSLAEWAVLSVLSEKRPVTETEQQGVVCKKQEKGVLRGFPTFTRKLGESRLATNQSPAHRAGIRKTIS